jgi:peptidoglycan/xylan/chitin deacetylase (PgdA/CDA1 family)
MARVSDPGPAAAAAPGVPRPVWPNLQQLLSLVDPQPLPEGAAPQQAWEWLSAGDWRIPARIAAAGASAGRVLESFSAADGRELHAVVTEAGDVSLPFDLDDAYRTYVTEAWRTSAPASGALSSRQLAAYYRFKGLVPRSARVAARRLYQRRLELPEFPRWPLELGVDRLLRFHAHCQLIQAGVDQAPFLWFWPDGHRAAMILTHDVESERGLRLALELADLEQDRGLRSSFNIVWRDYPIDHGAVRELHDRGFEVGIHGIHHDRSLFSSRAEFERQLPMLRDGARALGASGFRSPATHRVIDWLPELPVDYDCTVPHSDPYEPQPGGCASLWPFMLGRIVELPYTMPQDHTLFSVLQHSGPDVWLAQARDIEQRHGLIQLLTHPDRGYLGDSDKRVLYVELLDALSERESLWKPLPRDAARWWRTREARADVADRRQLGTVTVADRPEYAAFHPPMFSSPSGIPIA